MIERQDEGDSVIKILGLIKQRLSMESSEVFVEVHGEKVKWSYARMRYIFAMPEYVVVIVCSFRT